MTGSVENGGRGLIDPSEGGRRVQAMVWFGSLFLVFFFVVAGFIIHDNYREKIAAGCKMQADHREVNDREAAKTTRDIRALMIRAESAPGFLATEEGKEAFEGVSGRAFAFDPMLPCNNKAELKALEDQNWDIQMEIHDAGVKEIILARALASYLGEPMP